MTGMLASINSIEEARIILNTSVDIIDLKQPEQGALGALSTELVFEIVQFIANKKTVSATVGDLPMTPNIIFDAVNNMAKTGVDYIKIGFFPGGDWEGVLSKLAEITRQGQPLIAVLFADTQPDFNMINALKSTGFTGVMLDTMDKSKGSLLQVMPYDTIKNFVSLSQNEQLLCGLAGSLKYENISELLKLTPDYLGFRGALCSNHQRTAKIDTQAIDAITGYIYSEQTTTK